MSMLKRYDGAQWAPIDAGVPGPPGPPGSVASGPVAPTNPAVGQLWVDSTTSAPPVPAGAVTVDPTGLAVVTTTNVQAALAQLDAAAAAPSNKPGASIASAMITSIQTVTTAATWQDVTGMTMLIPAGVPWACDFVFQYYVLFAASGYPASGTGIYWETRVVNAADGSGSYGLGIKQWPSSGTSAARYMGQVVGSRINDPFTVDTVVKMQMLFSTLTGITNAETYSPDAVSPSVTMKATVA